jgi:hypothetical protein
MLSAFFELSGRHEMVFSPIILFAKNIGALTINQSAHQWASLPQIKQMMLLDIVVGPFVRTVVAPL